MMGYLIPAEPHSTEFRISNSKFISFIAPAFSVDQARSVIDQVKSTFPDATHHVAVYLIGHGSTVISHANDDGEPSGTAGRPALSVLRGSGLGDTVIVITRYFGGTKLGTGGLVKAYSESARKAIHSVKKARKISVHSLRIVCSYSYFEPISNLINDFQGVIDHKEFSEEVVLKISIPSEKISNFQASLQELSRGQIQATTLAKNQAALIPVPTSRQQ